MTLRSKTGSKIVSTKTSSDFSVIPVLDLKDGVVVHARAGKQAHAGKRAEYRPLATPFGPPHDAVAIARALVTNPALLLADEPTGNLDSVSGRDIMALFSRLNEQDMTIIMVTHQESVARFTHRTITLKDGRISSDGPCS